MIDQRARQILFKTYWSSAGWRPHPATSPADFEYARQAGSMFDPIVRSHDEVMDWLGGVLRQVDRRRVADAFLASLGTRRVELRSALGSYALARQIPEHSFQMAGACPTCGVYAGPRAIDLNVLSFERHKWGGVRHRHPDYAAFDLERFLAEDQLRPSEQDRAIMRRIVEAVRLLPARATRRDLDRQLAPLLPSNKAERDILAEILGYSGVLSPAGYSKGSRAFGIDAIALHDWFPDVE